MFVSQNTTLEYQFSKNMQSLLEPGGSQGLLNFPTGIDLDANHNPVQYGIRSAPGVIIRSTENGVAPRSFKHTFETCEGLCSHPQVVAACTTTKYRSAFCDPSRPGATTCGPNPATTYWSFSGCGFSDYAVVDGVTYGNSGLLGPTVACDTETTYGTKPCTASGLSTYNTAGVSIPCGLDCPRITTGPAFDDGNPTNPEQLTQQQKDRAVAFLFRHRKNITLTFRTEIGSAVLGNPNTEIYTTELTAMGNIKDHCYFQTGRWITRPTLRVPI